MKIIIQHKWAVILAVLVGLIIAFPHLYFRFEYRDIYQGIGFSGADEEAYLTRLQEIRDGHYATANYVWLEGKDLPYLLPPLSEIITSFLGRIFGLNLIDTAVLARFVFPAFVFLLIYALVYQLTRQKKIALAASLTVLLSTNLVEPRALWDLLIEQKTDNDFLPFSRLIAPPVHSLFLFGFLLLFWFFLQNKKWVYPAPFKGLMSPVVKKIKVFERRGVYGIFSGLVLGLSFYTYPYTWTFIFAFLGALLVIFVCQKRWSQIRSIFLISSIALLAALPYFWNLWQAIKQPLYSEVALRHGLVKTHQPQIGLLVLALLIIFLLLFSKERKERYSYCLALVLAPLIVLNQQLVTGRLLIPDHYHWYYHRPLAIIIFIIIIFEKLEKIINQPRLKRYGLWGLTGLILFVNFYNAWLVQSFSYKFRVSNAVESQRYGPVLKWLNDHAKKDEVVMGDETISYLTPIYTTLNAVSAQDGHYALIASEEQITERAFLLFRLNGLKAEEANKFFFENRSRISGGIYGQYYRKQLGEYGLIPDAKLYFLVDRYKEFLSAPLEEMLRKYHTDYLIWDTLKHPEWQIEEYSFLKQIYQAEGLKIYKI
ncbi:MAG: hypothetical protein A3I88_02460 [Candidatus Portnoybacteria bacterium RIFCSPLOWO2_12_FULL_39_9]|uniref:Glycosyltransferase RgtA/B/C/D-like domain-containing protein n=1 Tax=Candidatus Portnoybacteria bacterium RIFCSPHIGHO2_12_FULL_38_9 TaxID=1801997 RepID=A0A1G2FHW3_9BACT|nr:MAG: hypothetical protein A3H00_01770 [Candidatus Portnoybacteria bacterium RBG_13_40_8]OGZ35726.1 MAG: hypothetical protein A2646_02815 [Candidatus Portnoybacteria bacterium RIFCSPHIGHO2_02_FULL_39_12]OGZ37101.1 MAG: hypothetical protein A3J64_01140 [Candidatus Portnoybacteria bacterium RIFCSPHIGHO2_12_FULL_38_9]OGZ39470.1 MAG: hypothetical protein A3F21_03155 [Candidatus Portnoybacteria bacterium RIFCSPLOWO2_01_FULL_38_39]OGZ39698.1 MAG: hypothetical protein A3I88_02460 [Candidatus Portnoy